LPDRRLERYIKAALSRGHTPTEVRKKLLESGWHLETIDKYLESPRFRISGQLILINLLVLILVVGFLYFAGPFTGAFTAAGHDWENKVEISADNSQELIRTHIVFGDSKPTLCENGIYIEAEGVPVQFAIDNPTYADGVCTETDILIKNIIYAPPPENTSGENALTTFVTKSTTYEIYYGLLENVQPTEPTTEQPAELPAEQQPIEAQTLPEQTEQPRIANPGPDLSPLTISFTPLGASVTEFVNITASIRNLNATDAAGAFNVTFFVDEVSIGKTTISSLAASTTTTTSLLYESTSGYHSVKVFADSDGDQAETNETNNNLTQMLTIDWPKHGQNLAGNAIADVAGPTTNGTLWVSANTTGLIDGGPSVANGRVFVTTVDFATRRIFAFNQSTGTQLWNFTMANRSNTAIPLIAEGKVFVGTRENGIMHAVNESTGASIWNFTTGERIIGSANYKDGILYFGTVANATTAGVIFAVNATNGTQIRNFTLPVAIGIRSGAPAIEGNLLYTGVFNISAENGNITALNIPALTLNWTTNLTKGPAFSAPNVANGAVWIGSVLGSPADGRVYKLNATNGSIICASAATTAENVQTAPLVAEGKAFYGTGGTAPFARAINETNCSTIWTFTPQGGADGDVGASANGVMAYSNGILYFESGTGGGAAFGQVYALNATSGVRIFNYSFGNVTAGASPSAVNGVVFGASYAGQVVAIGNNVPTHTTPILNSSDGQNLTNSSLTCYNQSTTDTPGETVCNTFHFTINGTSYENLLMSFDTNNSAGTGKTRDYSSYGNNGTLGNATVGDAAEPTFVTTSVKGCGGYRFDGVNDIINITDNPSLDPVNVLTVESWVNLSSRNVTLSVKGIVGNYFADATPSGYLLDVLNDTGASTLRFRFDVFNGSDNRVTSTTNISANVFYHVVGVYNGTNLLIYVNGTLENTTAGPANISYEGANETPKIGVDYSESAARFFNGTIDEVRVYNRSLSSAEILEHFNLRYNNITQEETENGDTWQCAVTPSDSKVDGITKFSNNLTVVAPDLVPTIINWTPLGPINNTNILINATIVNRGSSNAGQFNVSFYVDDIFQSQNIVGPLAAGATNITTFSWATTSEVHDLKVFADSASQINESSETNNNLTDPIGVDWPTHHQSPQAEGSANTTGSNLTNPIIFTTNGSIFSSPVIANNYVYISSDDGFVYQLSAADLSFIAKFNTTGTTHLIHSTPVVYKGKVYVLNTLFDATTSRLFVLNATNVSIHIQNATLNFADETSSVIAADNKVYVVNFTQLLAVNASNVSQSLANFTREGTGNFRKSIPVYDDGFVYIGESVSPGSRVYKLQASNLQKVDNFTVPGTDGVRRVMSHNSILYTVFSNNSFNGTIAALNESNFSQGILHRFNFTGSSMDLYSTPAFFNNTIYIGTSTNRTLYALNATNLSQMFGSFLVPTAGAAIDTSPAVSQDGIVYFGASDKQIRSLNASNVSQLLTNYTTGAAITYSDPAIAFVGDAVYFGTNDNKTYMFPGFSFISCTFSQQAINFSNVAAFTDDNNATLNYAGAGSATLYNLTSNSNINVTVHNKGTNLVCIDTSCGTAVIGVGNLSWNSSKTSNTSIDLPGFNLTTAFDTVNPVAVNLTSGSSAWLRYWLDIPGSQAAGAYRGNYTIRCVAS